MIAAGESRTYRDKCLEAFNHDLSFGQNYFTWSLPRNAPETTQLFRAMRRIESGLFGKYLEQIRDETIEGCIVEFGVFEAWGLAKIIWRCEDLDLQREIFGFDSFEGLPE